jgi:hypothetical protein
MRLGKLAVLLASAGVSSLVPSCTNEPCRRPISVYDTKTCEIAPTITGCRPLPRCSATDPACGPQPVPGYDRCYRPGAPRKPLRARASNRPAECKHDGECTLGPCGLSCISYRHLVPYGDGKFLSNCMAHGPDRDDVLCGCVSGRCALFTQ